jgi:hypothetical protein
MPRKNPKYGGLDFSAEDARNITGELAIVAAQRTATADEKLVIAVLIPEIIRAVRSLKPGEHIVIAAVQSANAEKPEPTDES